jgi:hypothetical protein
MPREIELSVLLVFRPKLQSLLRLGTLIDDANRKWT